MAFQDAIKDLKDLDLNNLDFESIGTWPILAKAILWLVVFLAVVIGGYFQLIAPLRVELAQVTAKEQDLREEYKRKAFKAANLAAYRKQMIEMEETFGALLSQLPTDTEVPGLLEDITEEGVSNGLEITSIKLQPEVKKEFYIELPISIQVKGPYHDLAAFVSGIASLPRIVTLHDFKIGGVKGAIDLSMSITAKTYRYRDPEAG
ncbi:type 4a pilus biogenesis protein PilO [Litorivivens sp.]|uniref:type 4a pilus biogenesis protein PilO n=1 Tax=Litorivivens sp. TaxID=2020868 RepID=UPI00356A7CE9